MLTLLTEKLPGLERLLHGVKRLEAVGSAAREVDFDPTRSDVDFLVGFEPGLRRGVRRSLPAATVFAGSQPHLNGKGLSHRPRAPRGALRDPTQRRSFSYWRVSHLPSSRGLP